MSKIKIAIVLTVAVILTFATSCGGSGDTGEALDLTNGYVIAYSRASESDIRLEGMIEQKYADFGGKIESNYDKTKVSKKEIVLGGVDSREDIKALSDEFKANSNEMIGAYVLRVIGEKIYVFASCKEAEELVVKELFSYLSDNKLVLPKDVDTTVYFDLSEYRASGTIRVLSGGASDVAEIASLSIDGQVIKLERGKYEYLMSSAEPTDVFPTKEEIEVLLYDEGMTYGVSNSGSSIVINVKSKNGAKSQDYKFTYSFEDEYTVPSVIVNKDGAKGVLSLISDDGNQRTADFFYTVVAPKYSSFKISIAMPTRNIAALKQSSDGRVWLKEDNGNYVIEIYNNFYVSMIQNSVFVDKTAYATMVDFWAQILSSGQFELISHSHTHANWGVNDEYASGFPEGSVVKELHASAQILRDLLGQNSPFIARPGGHANMTSDYFYNLVSTDPTFVGMRTSNGAPPLPGASDTKLNSHERFVDEYNRLRIATLLVKATEAAFNESGTGFAYPSGGKAQTVVSAGVGAWTNYIDLAMANGQWASIAFHEVFDDTKSKNIADGYPVADSQVLQLMEYVQPLAESGELWVATFTEAAKYYFEWSTAEASATAYGDERVEVTLTDREEDPRMDMPLTVKVNVPGNWTEAELESYGTKTNLKVHVDEDGKCFVYANIVPGDEVSVIRAAK